METFDPRIDAYIEKAQPFAQPILTHLRDLVHKACPEVQETIKWGMPFFDYKGVMCNMAPSNNMLPSVSGKEICSAIRKESLLLEMEQTPLWDI